MTSLAMIRQNERVRWRRNQWIVWLVFAVLMAIMPHIFTSGFALSIMIQIGIAMIFATSYNMLLGQGGHF